MVFKFWKKETPAVREDYRLIKKVKKGGKKLDKEQKKLANMQDRKEKS